VGATLDCKQKPLAQNVALIKGVAMAALLNSCNSLNSSRTD
jgi:hypothetical protein